MSYSVEELKDGVWRKTIHEPADTKAGTATARTVLLSTGNHARLVGLFGAVIYDTRFDGTKPRKGSEE